MKNKIRVRIVGFVKWLVGYKEPSMQTQLVQSDIQIYQIRWIGESIRSLRTEEIPQLVSMNIAKELIRCDMIEINVSNNEPRTHETASIRIEAILNVVPPKKINQHDK